MKTQYIINTVSHGKIRSFVIQAQDARDAWRRVRQQVPPTVKVIAVKRVVKLSEDKQVY